MVNNKKANKNRRLPRCVRPEEYIFLLEVVPKKDQTFKMGSLLAYGSGLRIAEVLRCSPEHFRKKDIFIPESKYGVERYVPIPKGWKEEFTNLLPLKTSIRTLQRKFRKYNVLAKLNPTYTFHSLRHGFATRLLENGVPINQVSMLLGHADIKTTSIYVRANPVDAIKSYEDLF